MWDSKFAMHYVGSGFRNRDSSHVEFMRCCVEQCSTRVSEREIGVSLLKTLDEWNYCIWIQGWMPEPAQ